MLVESWFHSDAGHDPARPLRGLLRALARTPAYLRGEVAPAEETLAASIDSSMLADSVASRPGARPDLTMPAGRRRLKPQKSASTSPVAAKEDANRSDRPHEAQPRSSEHAQEMKGRRRDAKPEESGASRANAQLVRARPSGRRPVTPRQEAAPAANLMPRGAPSTAVRGASARGVRGEFDMPPVAKRPVREAAARIGSLRHLASGLDWDGGKSAAGRGRENSGSRGRKGATAASRHAAARPKTERRGERGVRRPLPAHASTHAVKSLLGTGQIKPPSGELVPPDFARLLQHEPSLLGEAELPAAAAIERLAPPAAQSDYRAWLAQDGTKPDARWHEAGDVRYLHDRPLWAAESQGRRAPMVQSGARWWTLAEGGQPLLWHEGRWWWQKDGVWFLLHEGQPWAYRWFSDWQTEGLLEPQSQTRIVYSADGSMAAVGAPGERTVVFDLRTGEEVPGDDRQPERTSSRPPRSSR